MNILILNWRDIKNPKKGGAELILYELSKRLIQNNHTVTWFSSTFPGSKEKETFEGINFIRQGNEFTVYLHAYKYYRDLSIKPDKVFDCVNTVCWQTPLYIPFEKRILYANQSARKIFFYEYPFFLALFFYLLEPLQYLTYGRTKTLCYSLSIKHDLLSFGISKKLAKTFPLGIDHTRYVKGKKSKNPTFIFVARFVKNKRADLCIKAMRDVIKTYSKATLYLIGYGEQEKNLKKLIEDLSITKNVIVINKNNDYLQRNVKDVKVKFMQEAWALLLPSVKEGWGMVVTEVGACGTLSVVSNITGLRDSVIHNKTGIVLSENPTPEELAVSMTRIIKDKKIREKMSQGAYEYSWQFTWDNSFKSFCDILGFKNEKK